MRCLVALLLTLSLPALGQYGHRSNPGDPATTAPAITSAGSGNCPGTGCVVLNANGAGAMLASVTGTWTATLAALCSNDAWTTTKVVLMYPLTSGALGAGVTTTTGNGDWVLLTSPYRSCGLYASAFTSNTSMAVRLDADSAVPIVTQLTNGLNTKVDQGSAGTLAQSWFAQLSDATTGPVAVKAASTTPAATDKALVVGLSPNLPALTRGTQGAVGFSTQDLKDAGRVAVILNADGVTPASSDTVLTFDKNVAGTVTTGQTSYTITSGKILRLQSIMWSFTDSSATAVRVRAYLRWNTGGACIAGSGKVLSCELASPGLGTSAANEGNAVCAIPIPDGLELAGGGSAAICLSAIASSAAGTLTATAVGYEY